MIPPGEIAISNSEITKWKQCRRQWALTYYWSFQPADQAPAGRPSIIGTRGHAALEAFYGYGVDPLRALEVIYGDALATDPEWHRELAIEHQLLANIISGYLEHLEDTGADRDLELVATESDIRLPVPGVPGALFRARLDQRLLRKSDRTVCFLDHKFPATFDKRNILAIDDQMPFYQMLLTMDSPSDVVSGGIFNMLRRVKRAVSAKPPFYHREQFTYTPQRIQSIQRRAVTSVKEIIRARKILDDAMTSVQGMEPMQAAAYMDEVQQTWFMPTPSQACSWACAFSELCVMMDDGSAWGEVLANSGRFTHTEPYAYYHETPLPRILEALAK